MFVLWLAMTKLHVELNISKGNREEPNYLKCWRSSNVILREEPPSISVCLFSLQLCVVMIFLVSVIMYRGIVSMMMYHTGNSILMTQVRRNRW